MISHPTAWTAGTLSADDGRLVLDTACLQEIEALAKLLRDNPLPTIYLKPEDFDLPHCRALMAKVAAELVIGRGFVIIDRLPLEAMSREAALSIYWLLMALAGRPVAQSWDGKMLYGVADSTGKAPGNGIRADVTNAEQNFHTDNSYNLCPPDQVALLCLRPAKTGGISRLASLTNAHNVLREQQPALLARLYQPFFIDRQREHAPEDVKVITRPALQNSGGQLRTRLSGQLIRQGYELAGEQLDAPGQAALAAIYEILNDAAHYKEFFFEPGQIQIIDNQRLAHKRTNFEDWPEAERKRHLVRIWLRQAGRPFYNG